MQMGKYKKTENIPSNSKDRSQFSQVKYQFFLDAPFEISNHCCSVFKKELTASYGRKTGRKPITAQTASESRLRTQVWLRNGCNAFEAKKQISNPMSFWTEQDVLLYIRNYNVKICSVYGDVVKDCCDQLEGQLALDDLDADKFGIFDIGVPLLKTTGADRTGCLTCCYGLHLDKFPSRFDILSKTHPKFYDWIMRGGAFDTDGKWKPKGGLGLWFVLEWCNVHGNMGYEYPNSDYYIKTYSTEKTDYWLKKDSSWFNNKLMEKIKEEQKE